MSITRIIGIFILLNILAVSTTVGPFVSTGTSVAHSDKTKITPTDISKGSSSSTTNYIQSIQQKENVFIESYLLGKDEFNIDDDITIQFRIRNELSNPIYCEDIIIPIAKEFKIISCNCPKTAYWNNVTDGISIKPETLRWDGDKQTKGILISPYNSIVFNYTIRTDTNRPYILPQAIIKFNSRGSSKRLYSAPLYFKVINSYPEITSITISPPWINTEPIDFNITFRDANKIEIMSVQVWSNIDNILYDGQYKGNGLNDSYKVTFTKKLSIGTHLLTFRINDSHDGLVEKVMTIEVKQTIFRQYMQLYGIAAIIMLCGIINVLNILGLLKYFKTNKLNLLAIALMLISFLILFVLPIYLLSALRYGKTV